MDRAGRHLVNNPGWAASELMTMRRLVRRCRAAAGVFATLLVASCAGLAPLFLGASEKASDTGGEAWMLPSWLWITLAVVSGLLTLTYALASRSYRRRRHVVEDVVRHSGSITELKAWFSAPPNEGPWWKVWAPRRRAAIEWLHKRVRAARDSQLPSGRPAEAAR